MNLWVTFKGDLHQLKLNVNFPPSSTQVAMALNLGPWEGDGVSPGTEMSYCFLGVDSFVHPA